MKGVIRMKRDVSRIIAVAGLLVLLIPCSGFGELKLGNLRLYPEIGIEEMYRSNIYQTDRDRKSDFITSILPGIRTEYLFGGDHSLNLGYSGAWKTSMPVTPPTITGTMSLGRSSPSFSPEIDFGVEHRYINNWYERSVFIDCQRHYIEKM